MYPPKSPLYFGCWGGVGHYVRDCSGQMVDRSDWLSFLDGKLTPEDRTEGVARLHHFNGCTLLAFWDSSVDSRPGSNSAFLLPNPRLTFDRAVAAAKVAFPKIWERFKFDVVPERNP